jgi:prepilin-type processing-associated H-X9-DG protein
MDILVARLTLKTMRVISDSKWVQRIPLFGKKRTEAFTLGDLVAVVAIVGLGAAILLPVLFRAKLVVQEGACIGDLHQIQNGWILYNNENDGDFPYNVVNDGSTNINWVANHENYSGEPCDTNSAMLVNPRYSLLAPFVRNPAAYRCPADQSRSFGLTGGPRVRSYSMSQAIGPNVHGTVTNPNQGEWLGSLQDNAQVNVANSYSYTVYLNNGMMVGPIPPSDLIVLADEHPDSINDGSWAFNMPSSPSQTYWIDVPTPLHGNAGSFSFADGHAEIHAWQDPAEIPAVTYDKQIGGITLNEPKDPDVFWTASHISTVYPP